MLPEIPTACRYLPPRNPAFDIAKRSTVSSSPPLPSPGSRGYDTQPATQILWFVISAPPRQLGLTLPFTDLSKKSLSKEKEKEKKKRMYVNYYIIYTFKYL